MITTVTTATITTLSSVIATSLTLISILTLIWLLAQSELISSLSDAWAVRMRRAVYVAVVPLVVVFVTSIIIHVSDLLK